MSTERKPGMDHPHYEWSPMSERGVLQWPNGARVALCVIVNLEHHDYQPSPNSYRSPTLAGGRGIRPLPDYAIISSREYGNRVGVFRVFEALDRHRIKGTAAIDGLTAENRPTLVEECKQRGWEFIGHGMAVNRMITSQMSEEEERDYIQSSLDALNRASGAKAVGWLGPEFGESTRTPALLAEAGVRYVCDWANDEQPYEMTVPTGELFALPIMWEMDDTTMQAARATPVHAYAQLLKDGFDTVYRDSERSGRLIVLNLHPWFIGQPFRIKYLEEALAHMMSRQGVWAATGSEIIDWYRDHRPAR